MLSQPRAALRGVRPFALPRAVLCWAFGPDRPLQQPEELAHDSPGRSA